MKKTLAIVAVAAMATVSAMAQGTLLFATFGGTNNYQILLPGTGTPATATDGVLADLFYGSVGSGVTNDLGLAVSIQGAGIFTATATGNQNPVTIPTIAANANAFVMMRAWKGGTSYANATFRAQSPIYPLQLGGGTTPPANIPFGPGTLLLVAVPEPGTLALAALGLGGLLLIRRRK
jgi:hypothetical protein